MCLSTTTAQCLSEPLCRFLLCAVTPALEGRFSMAPQQRTERFLVEGDAPHKLDGDSPRFAPKVDAIVELQRLGDFDYDPIATVQLGLG